MGIADDVDNLVSPNLWGQQVTLRVNTPSYNAQGAATDSWATSSTPNAILQPLATAAMITTQGGQQKLSTHFAMLPNGTTVSEGYRLRPNGWDTGDDEYVVLLVRVHEGWVQALLELVKGNA